MKTIYSEIINKIDLIDPIKYSKNRNFIDGSVTRLSPYISRGMISTKFIFEKILEKNIPFWKVEKFVQELCWRDYWQIIWKQKGHLINYDLKKPQEDVLNNSFSKALFENLILSSLISRILTFNLSPFLNFFRSSAFS